MPAVAERGLFPNISLTRTELECSSRLGIYDENHTLTAAAIWGPIGTEAALAQSYPEDISLFHTTDMDVLGARREAQAFSETLQSHGVFVVHVRDRLASILPPVSYLSPGLLLQELIHKADEVQRRYNTYRPGVDAVIEELLRQDIELYGEEAALALNHTLSLAPQLPLGNSMFARDQSNVILGQRIRSSMAKPIREREVQLFEMVYEQLGATANNERLAAPYHLPKGETFEGGDAYVHDGIVYVGVGARTTWGAAIAIRDALKEELAETGFDFVVVADPDAQTRAFRDQMDFMHLDTFSTPIGPKQMLVCEEETARRQVYRVDEDGKVTYTGSSFLSFLAKQGNEVLVVPRKEQQAFGVNLLALDHETMLIPFETNSETVGSLRRAGKTIVNLDLIQSTKGSGAAHCMTFQIYRSRNGHSHLN